VRSFAPNVYELVFGQAGFQQHKTLLRSSGSNAGGFLFLNFWFQAFNKDKTKIKGEKMKFMLEIKGDLACFTRPEYAVERSSYNFITPSAAKGIFESIYWKPEFTWIIKEIWVINEIKWFNCKRNEVKSKASPKVKSIDIAEDRTQRGSRLLRDVHYVVVAEMVVHDNDILKHSAIFAKRAERGRFYYKSYLGCREFSCDCTLVKPEEAPNPLPMTRDFGWCLHSVFENNQVRPGFYRAKMNAGIILVPEPNSKEVLRNDFKVS
jgi:CRISPR-associated protein Cas5d